MHNPCIMQANLLIVVISMAKKRAAIVGATGIAGQQIIAALENHPWFEIAFLAASERSAGKKFRDAITDASGAKKWFCKEQASERTLDLTVQDASKLDAQGVDLVFTAVESDVAKELEPKYAMHVPVISTASAFRYEKDVPILIPGVNDLQAKLIEVQKANRGWNGFVTPIPNCTTTGFAVTLKPIFDKFGIENLIMTSMQGISGAGRSPGVIGLDILDNIVPYIPKEEEKVEIETKKIFGTLSPSNDSISDAKFSVSATCTRVSVIEGHTESVLVSCSKPCEAEEVKKAMRDFAPREILALPSAPKRMITVHDDPYRPQPRLDRDADGGMTTSVGRVRKDNVLKNGVKYLLVSHNTMMGAGKGAVFVAETLHKLYGYI